MRGAESVGESGFEYLNSQPSYQGGGWRMSKAGSPTQRESHLSGLGAFFVDGSPFSFSNFFGPLGQLESSPALNLDMWRQIRRGRIGQLMM